MHRQPFTLKAGALFLATGVGLYFYFDNEKNKVRERKRMENAAARVGRPKIGGPFALTNQDGKPFSDQDLVGKWSMVYVRPPSLSTSSTGPSLMPPPSLPRSSASPTAPTSAPRSSTR